MRYGVVHWSRGLSSGGVDRASMWAIWLIHCCYISVWAHVLANLPSGYATSTVLLRVDVAGRHTKAFARTKGVEALCLSFLLLYVFEASNTSCFVFFIVLLSRFERCFWVCTTSFG